MTLLLTDGCAGCGHRPLRERGCFVTGGVDKTARLWAAATGEKLKVLNGHAGTVTSVAFSNDDKRIASGDANGIIKIWDAATGKVLRTLTGHKKAVLAVAFGFDGTRLISLDAAGVLRYWNVGFPTPVQLSGKKAPEK